MTEKQRKSCGGENYSDSQGRSISTILKPCSYRSFLFQIKSRSLMFLSVLSAALVTAVMELSLGQAQ